MDAHPPAVPEQSAPAQPQQAANAYEQVMSLLDLDMGGPPATTTAPMQAAPAAPENAILNMLNSGAAMPEPVPVQAAPPVMEAQPPIQNLMGGDDFGGFESAPSVEQLYIAFEDANLKVEVKMNKDISNPNKTDYCALFTNLSGSAMQKAQIQVAGLKYLKVSMKKVNKEELGAFESRGATQEFSVLNSEQGTKKVILRIKVLYTKDGQQIESVKTLNDIPQ